MMSTLPIRLAVLLFMMLAGCATAADRPTVSASGTADAMLAPDYLRLATVLQERGSKVADLLKSATARAADIEKKLKSLGAATVTVGELEVVPVSADQRRQMQAALARLKQIKQGQQGEEAFVQVRVTAEWPLTGDVAAQHVKASELRHQLTDAVKPPKDDESGDDDSDGLRMLGSESKPGQVTCLYGKRVPEDVVKKTFAEAYAKAEAAARALAEAAGQTLGPLYSLTKASRAEVDEPMDREDYALRQALAAVGAKRTGTELIGAKLEPLAYRAGVHATFELKPR